jgi:hypothetical protein
VLHGGQRPRCGALYHALSQQAEEQTGERAGALQHHCHHPHHRPGPAHDGSSVASRDATLPLQMAVAAQAGPTLAHGRDGTAAPDVTAAAASSTSTRDRSSSGGSSSGDGNCIGTAAEARTPSSSNAGGRRQRQAPVQQLRQGQPQPQRGGQRGPGPKQQGQPPPPSPSPSREGVPGGASRPTAEQAAAARTALSRFLSLQEARSPEAKAAAQLHPEALSLMLGTIQEATGAGELEAVVDAFGARLLHHGVAAGLVRLEQLVTAARQQDAQHLGRQADSSRLGSSSSSSGGGGGGSSGGIGGGGSSESHASGGSSDGSGSNVNRPAEPPASLAAAAAAEQRAASRLLALLKEHGQRLCAAQVGLLLRTLPKLAAAGTVPAPRVRHAVALLQARGAAVMAGATDPATLCRMAAGPAALAHARQEPAAAQRASPALQPSRQGAPAAAAAPAGTPDPAYVDAWLQQSAVHLPAFSPSQLAVSIQSLARLGRPPPAEWQGTFLEVTERLLEMSAAAAASADPPIDGGAEGGSCDEGGSGSGVEVSGEGSSSSSGGRGGGEIGGSESGDETGLFSASDLSSLIWGLARLGIRPEETWAAAFRGACRRVYWRMPGVAVANILWGAARLRLPVTPAWLKDMMWQAQRRARDMDANRHAAVAWALAELHAAPPQAWVTRYCKQVCTFAAERFSG